MLKQRHGLVRTSEFTVNLLAVDDVVPKLTDKTSLDHPTSLHSVVVLVSLCIISIVLIWPVKWCSVSLSPVGLIWKMLVEVLQPEVDQHSISQNEVWPNWSFLTEMLHVEAFSLEVKILRFIVGFMCEVALWGPVCWWHGVEVHVASLVFWSKIEGDIIFIELGLVQWMEPVILALVWEGIRLWIPTGVSGVNIDIFVDLWIVSPIVDMMMVAVTVAVVIVVIVVVVIMRSLLSVMIVVLNGLTATESADGLTACSAYNMSCKST